MERHLENTCSFPCDDPLCLNSVKRNAETGRWFITIGHAGFNTAANNGLRVGSIETQLKMAHETDVLFDCYNERVKS